MHGHHTTAQYLLFVGPLLFCVFLFSGVSAASAAVTVPTGFGDYISIEKNPEFPGPNEEVQVSIGSTSVDLNSATITWSVDGVLQKKGIGIKEYTLTTKDLGSLTTVDAIIAPSKGAFLHQRVILRPAGVSLIWEALSYTHPFYRGKALNAFDGRVRITALPQFVQERGGRAAPSELVYTWKKNGTVVGDAGGYGKNVFTPNDPISFSRGESSIEVVVTAPNDTVSARDAITIRPFDPKVLLYENDPLLGIRYEHALSGVFTLTKDELVLAASPYFFSSKERAGPSLSYEWTMNGVPTKNQIADASSVRFRQEGNPGTSIIDLTIKKIDAIFQEARVSLSVAFGQ